MFRVNGASDVLLIILLDVQYTHSNKVDQSKYIFQDLFFTSIAKARMLCESFSTYRVQPGV